MSKEIPLTQGMVAIVDDEDYEQLSSYHWQYQKETGYARRNDGTRKTHRHIYMHRQIMNAAPGIQVDHIHGNKLDNRKSELRLCTNKENSRNQSPVSEKRRRTKTSKFKGVCWAKNRGRWVAHITVDRRCIHLGYFDHEIDAANAYDNAAKAYYGEYARINNDDSR